MAGRGLDHMSWITEYVVPEAPGRCIAGVARADPEVSAAAAVWFRGLHFGNVGAVRREDRCESGAVPQL